MFGIWRPDSGLAHPASPASSADAHIEAILETRALSRRAPRQPAGPPRMASFRRSSGSTRWCGGSARASSTSASAPAMRLSSPRAANRSGTRRASSRHAGIRSRRRRFAWPASPARISRSGWSTSSSGRAIRRADLVEEDAHRERGRAGRRRTGGGRNRQRTAPPGGRAGARESALVRGRVGEAEHERRPESDPRRDAGQRPLQHHEHAACRADPVRVRVAAVPADSADRTG